MSNWICACGQSNDGNFCIKCGSPKPSAEVDTDSESMGNWTCTCGQSNDGKFCIRCGSPKPSVEVEVDSGSMDNWTCTCGQSNDGKFCIKCGSPKPSAEVDTDSEFTSNWICACGQSNDGKFCISCGSSKPNVGMDSNSNSNTMEAFSSFAQSMKDNVIKKMENITEHLDDIKNASEPTSIYDTDSSGSEFVQNADEINFPKVSRAGRRWICICGKDNEYSFCSECGSIRDDLTDPRWDCLCGAKNDERFCYNCGKSREAIEIEIEDAIVRKKEAIREAEEAENAAIVANDIIRTAVEHAKESLILAQKANSVSEAEQAYHQAQRAMADIEVEQNSIKMAMNSAENALNKNADTVVAESVGKIRATSNTVDVNIRIVKGIIEDIQCIVKRKNDEANKEAKNKTEQAQGIANIAEDKVGEAGAAVDEAVKNKDNMRGESPITTDTPKPPKKKIDIKVIIGVVAAVFILGIGGFLLLGSNDDTDIGDAGTTISDDVKDEPKDEPKAPQKTEAELKAERQEQYAKDLFAYNESLKQKGEVVFLASEVVKIDDSTIEITGQFYNGDSKTVSSVKGMLIDVDLKDQNGTTVSVQNIPYDNIGITKANIVNGAASDIIKLRVPVDTTGKKFDHFMINAHKIQYSRLKNS